MLRYNGANSYIFVNGVEIYKFKAKDSQIKAVPLRLDNVSKDISDDNMKRLDICRYEFSIDYDSIDVADILDIHKFLMKKHDIR